MLDIACWVKGYAQTDWVSYRQAKQLGGQVRKGEKGTFIFAPLTLKHPIKAEDEKPASTSATKAEAPTEQEAAPVLLGFKACTVFNLAQIDGLAVTEPPPQPPRHDLAERLLTTSNAKLKEGIPPASYNPGSDTICTAPSMFKNQANYWPTLLHELAHWTGAKQRLNRPYAYEHFSRKRAEYAYEELVAEMGSAYLCRRLGIAHTLDDHASYIAMWAKHSYQRCKRLSQSQSTSHRSSQLPRETPCVKELWGRLAGFFPTNHKGNKSPLTPLIKVSKGVLTLWRGTGGSASQNTNIKRAVGVKPHKLFSKTLFKKRGEQAMNKLDKSDHYDYVTVAIQGYAKEAKEACPGAPEEQAVWVLGCIDDFADIHNYSILHDHLGAFRQCNFAAYENGLEEAQANGTCQPPQQLACIMAAYYHTL